MASPKVIVFGPTGGVGSATALTAAKRGANVALAMRDTSKTIPGLSSEEENQGNFERIEADLTKPETVGDAVKKAGAKRAFIYSAHGSSDHMRSTIEALKSAGIELVVLLSSFTIQGDPRNIQPSEVIPWLHAQVEINLEEIFGSDGYVAARPGSFASNNFGYKEDIQKGEVEIWCPEKTVDCIAPEDIGRVCGTVLAEGPRDGERAIYLYGPKLLRQDQVVQIMANAMGKNPTIRAASEEEAYKLLVERRGFPPALAKYFVEQVSKPSNSDLEVFGYPITKEQMDNVLKYTGSRAITFEEWLQQNKQLFLS